MAPTIASIQQAVATEYGIPVSTMRDRDALGTRVRPISWPRQEAMRLASLLTEHSYVRIGYYFGHRDHTTVILGCRAVARRIQTDDKLKTRMRRLTLDLVKR